MIVHWPRATPDIFCKCAEYKKALYTLFKIKLWHAFEPRTSLNAHQNLMWQIDTDSNHGLLSIQKKIRHSLNNPEFCVYPFIKSKQLLVNFCLNLSWTDNREIFFQVKLNLYTMNEELTRRLEACPAALLRCGPRLLDLGVWVAAPVWDGVLPDHADHSLRLDPGQELLQHDGHVLGPCILNLAPILCQSF